MTLLGPDELLVRRGAPWEQDAQTLHLRGQEVSIIDDVLRIALASYSGMVHVYASDEEELPGRIDGLHPRRELYRRLMWEHLPGGPIRW